MIIFDRWGHMVYETRDPARGWDGTINGEYAEAGVYTFMATYKNPEAGSDTQKVAGNLTLVK